MTDQHELHLERGAEVAWVLSGPGAEKFVLVNQYLGYLADRNYSPRTLRAYGYDLLAFCRWLDSEQLDLGAVTTETVLDFMRHCRQAPIAGRPANVLSMTGKRLDRYFLNDHQPPSGRPDGAVHLPGAARTRPG
jgi:site-specific recombinase XerD